MLDGHELVRTFHSTCMVTDYDATTSALARLAGLRILEYSVNETIGRRGGMTWVGDNSLEVAQPIVQGHAAERFLSRLGPGMHSYALQVRNLDATITHLADGGVTLGVRPADGFCFTDPRSTGGILFEWSDFTVKEDPRIGGVLPPSVVNPILEVRAHAFIGAVVADPLAWADTFGSLFGLTEAFRHSDAPAGEPMVGLAAPDCVLALYRLPGADGPGLWGCHHPRARCHVLGLGVPDLEQAHAALMAEGIGLVRRDDHQLILDPSDTGEVPVVVVAEPLPGDPRQRW